MQDARRSREKYLAENNGIAHPQQGWRLRTIMVTDIPSGLRNDAELAGYFKVSCVLLLSKRQLISWVVVLHV